MHFQSVYGSLATVVYLVALCSARLDQRIDINSESSFFANVPDCARTCVENFIKTEYTEEACTSALELTCLCRKITPSGLTIGEGALSCIYALCSQAVVEQHAKEAYHMCNAVPNALAETHATITATTFSSVPSTTASVVTTATISVSGTATIAADGTSSTSTSTASTVVHETTSMSNGAAKTTATDLPNTTSTNFTSPVSEKHAVSPGTVIGISVGSGVAGSFIIGVAVFFLCKRWRQKHESEFEIGGEMSEPPGFSELGSSRRSSPNPHSGPPPSPFNATSDCNELPRSLQANNQYTREPVNSLDAHNSVQARGASRIGFAITSDSDVEASPRTKSSQYTLAEVLGGTTEGLYPKPLKWSHRPTSGETLFEEDELQAAAVEKHAIHGQTSDSPSLMPGLPANPRAIKNGFPAENFLRPEYRSQSRQGHSMTGAQPNQTEKRLGSPFTGTAMRGSSTSNSSGALHDYSTSSHNTSSTLTTPPSTTAQGRLLSGLSPRRAEPHVRSPSTNTIWPTSEVISQPRLVRKDDIKRVQVRSNPRPPSEVVVPYCPEDFWLERGRAQAPVPRASSELPYPSEVCPGVVLYPSSPKRRPQDAPDRMSPTSRNLTPSRRGNDLILKVD